MTPKEKAIELVEKYMPHIAGVDRYNTTLGLYDKTISKQCALIAVDEIINECHMWHGGDYIEWDIKRFKYWQEVRKEIEKL